MSTFPTHAIEWMVNRTVAGKIPTDADRAIWQRFHSSWQPATGTARDLAVAIYRGYAYTQMYSGGRKRKENFSHAWALSLDFDTEDDNSSLDTLSLHPFAALYGSFAYSTPSSRTDAPRSRLVFVFEKPIRSAEKFRALYCALLDEFPHADKSTKDPLRLFFGSLRCEMRPLGNCLPVETVDLYVEHWQEQQRQQMAAGRVVRVTPDEVPDSWIKHRVVRMLDGVKSAVDGEKHHTLCRYAFAFGGYVAAGYFSESDAIDWLCEAARQMRNVKSFDAAAATIQQCVRDGMAQPIYIEVQQAPRLGAVI